jgi:peptidoglycan/xylan/chitin deacetylase (PgdA/CDA1 family)
MIGGTQHSLPLRLPILTYHSIDESGSVISIDSKSFVLQMEYLAKNGYRTLTLAEAALLLQGKVPPSPRAVVLTFDDGYSNVYESALPVLKRFGFTATVFLVSGSQGGESLWLTPRERFPRLRTMRLAEVEAILAAGWKIGGHSASHRRLTKLGTDRLEEELDASRAFLESLTGDSNFWFAYPYGAYDAGIRDMVARRFAGACTTRLGFASAASDRYGLERIDTYYLQRPFLWQSLETRRLAAYLAVRRLLRRCRYRESH